jgi:hypothetical protein
VAGPGVVAGLQTEPLGTSAVAGLLTEPPHAVAASRLPTTPLTVGSTIFVDLPEHGISADFTVREIRPCPTPMAGDGYLVTTKFIHENAEILDLRVEGSDEPIGTTASHPFWSEDRQQFVAAGELRVGENLRLADDTTRKVESLTRRENRETVYNIEVDGEHVFYVGEDGVLVHNSCGDVLLGQTMDRVIGVAAKRGWRWLGKGSRSDWIWDWKKNRDFLYHAMKNARDGKARILDIGFDPAKGFKGKFTLDEMKLLVRNGFRRRWTGDFVEIDGVQVRLFEWIPR